jgi:hypothetical protein
VEPHREETNRTSKEAISRWNKAGLRETRDIKLGRKSAKSGIVKESVVGDKHS